MFLCDCGLRERIDAERYRFLRDRPLDARVFVALRMAGVLRIAGTSCDNTVDEAMAREGRGIEVLPREVNEGSTSSEGDVK
ncbi:MAG TPA: hypothetical protein VMU47_11010 [Caldimonas sp.]|nr:hypothetical protein [Caldimonas sp.]